MVPVKILCGCGQKYSFEVEPAGGKMPWVVTCPICGTDGTAAANAAIAQNLALQPRAVAMPAPVALLVPSPAAAAPAPAMAPRAASASVAAVSSAAPASAPSRKLLPGQVPPEQAKIEAKAKISWGDSPEDVMAYLMIQGFGRAEAMALAQQMFIERAATIRRNGIGKMMVGTGMMFVPVVFYFVFVGMGAMGSMLVTSKLFAIPVIIGLWGIGKVLKGIFMVASPRTERGDVAQQ